MISVQPVVLEGRGIRLEPLREEHAADLAGAAGDGRLWELWYTAVPVPEKMRDYVGDALKVSASWAAASQVAKVG